MTNPTALNAMPKLQSLSLTLNANLIALEKIRRAVENSLTSAIEAEVVVRRMGLREANQRVDDTSDALADASRLQGESNEAFRQIREQLAEICTCVDIVKGRIVSLDARIQSVRMD